MDPGAQIGWELRPRRGYDTHPTAVFVRGAPRAAGVVVLSAKGAVVDGMASGWVIAWAAWDRVRRNICELLIVVQTLHAWVGA